MDGCKAGWFAVSLTENNEWETEVFSDIFTLWDSLWGKYQADLKIFIDIPIGLRENTTKERLCDLQARKLLRKRGPAVFPAPCRQALNEKTHKNASSVNKEYTGRGLSIMAWSIVPKILQADQLMCADENARSYITEIHPELCFYGFAGNPMKHSKKEEEGLLERKNLLMEIYPPADRIVKHALSKYKRKDVAKDDILDALAAALTAKLGSEKRLIKIPENPEHDSKGLPMRMVYFSNKKEILI
ncbi:MAG: DUF429 domain-containing protein [Methanosarcina sp.]|nr:DUF429 domain-containing protein [Methanosarcina sp.]